MDKIRMLYFDRIDISEGADANKASLSRECDICHYCRGVTRVPKCSIRGNNNQLPNIFYKFVHLQLFNIKHKFVHLQLN